MHYHINLISASNINSAKWDKCILNASNGLIYSQYSYLNAIADHWDAIIINDYETIMPIPWRIKAGIKYAYTPAFIQQLGFVGELNNIPIQLIIKQIQQRFKYGTLLFNNGNDFIEKIYPTHKKLNLIQPLNQTPKLIFSKFRSDHSQSILKAKESGMIYLSDLPIHKTFELYKKYHAKKTPHITNGNYEQFENYCSSDLAKKNKCFTRTILNKEGALLATALFLSDHKRLYNILNTTTLEGRSMKANHYLFYLLMNEFSEQHLILDFEGSSLPGVAEFYGGFGAEQEYYYSYHYNKLPFPLSLFR
ncbi:MAG: hypothetical protein EAZ35_01885 [Sphingobacteriia bacterium]|nr:MAG: hypothetical protein EAZ41_07600 [Sphingobacteriia bacterium]TAG31828.1 MAG: hypothetical protein EAZ35_01885 [Sphingobacteriia bacterium]